MAENPAVSFVIPCYRGRQTIGETLKGILGQQTALQTETLVVDSSPDDTAEWIERHWPAVRVIASPTRLWAGQARNRGAAASCGRWLAFLDADARPQPDWLEILLAALREPGRILAGGWVGNANPETQASRILHWIEFSEFLPGLPNGPRSLLSSSNWLISREAFEGAGGFSEEAAMSEDSIFCRSLGSGIYFEGGTGVWHRHRSCWEEVGPYLNQLGYWSGAFRRDFKGAGSWLRRAPALSFLLPALRAARICARVLRANPGQSLQTAISLPALTKGLFHWANGFRRGIAG